MGADLVPEEVLDDLAQLRDRAPPSDPSSGGCAVAVVSVLALVLMPFAGSGFDLAGPTMGWMGLGLSVIAVAGALMGFFGGGFYRGALISKVEKAIETFENEFPGGRPDVIRGAAVHILDGAHLMYGPTTRATFDFEAVRARLGEERVAYLLAVEEILLRDDLIYPVFSGTDGDEDVTATGTDTSVDGSAPS